ncbi:MAG: hypothetical protein JSU06_10200 [Actinobacteria bacterium]|nr:hypothetical protein [Actinomycetota bacterium]
MTEMYSERVEPDRVAVPLMGMPEEALRILEAAAGAGVLLRLLGGLAIELSMPVGASPFIPRPYKDIDFATADGQNRRLRELMAELGYQEPEQFNALNGGRRLLFFDEHHDRQIDVFVGAFVMCHEIQLKDRLSVRANTIPLAELLLTKLQIVEMNEKDQVDIYNLLYEHALGDSDPDVIDQARIAELCAADWGLWRTTTLNLAKGRHALAQFNIPDEARGKIATRLSLLERRIEEEPKSRKWKMRNRVGDRVKWYEEPEEVH